MTKLISLNALAAATLAVALPLTASANSVAQEQAFERLNQSTASQTANSAKSERNQTIVNVGEGHSAAMSNALERTNHTDTPDHAQRETVSVDLDWSGDSEATADALRRVNQPDAS